MLLAMTRANFPDERRMTAKGRATRERILQAAAELILAEGLSGLSLDKVRKAASVSGSQLTHYYADKRALIRAVITRQIEVVLDFHRQPKLGGLDTFDDFERWIDLNVRYLRRIGYDRTPTYHALTGQLAKSDDVTRQTLASGYARWIELLEQSFQRMKDRGVLVTKSPAQTAGAGRRRLPPRRRHPHLHLPSRMASGGHAALRGELPAHVRRRPCRAHRAPAPASARPAPTRDRSRGDRRSVHTQGFSDANTHR